MSRHSLAKCTSGRLFLWQWRWLVDSVKAMRHGVSLFRPGQTDKSLASRCIYCKLFWPLNGSLTAKQSRVMTRKKSTA